MEEGASVPKHLWAPWRAEYFRTPKGGGCVFCGSASPAAGDADRVLLRERTCFALLNAFPYTGGHLMVAPYRHTARLDDLADGELADLIFLARRCARVLERAFRPDGMNLGFNLGAAAGAGIAEHLHLHVVPRWTGDTNFMTVIGGHRVVSEGLRETREKFMATLAELEPHAHG
ncbi:MAG: HIT domain-containing protein [Verrucomicrobiae bacterium]|nr:HIT domain-containing protein [Verrucomicrobiae bacterium]